MNMLDKTSNGRLCFGLLALLLWAAGGCRKQLDTVPLSSYTSESFWNSESNTLLALTGLYRGNIQMRAIPAAAAEFSATDWWSYHGLVLLDLATDNAYDRRGDNSGINRLTNGTLTADNPYLGNYWSSSYSRIARCNYFLENIGRAGLQPGPADRMQAEACLLYTSPSPRD